VIVVDTSAALAALAGRPSPADLRERLAEGADIRKDFADLAIVRYPHQPLADRMWELRHNLSAYDAAFVALSEALGVPLVTCDGRLASSSGHQAEIELFPVS
jgi:predicted nucleic acid-binding protein